MKSNLTSELFFGRPLKEWGYKTSAGQVGWRGGSTEEYRRRWGEDARKLMKSGNKKTLRREADGSGVCGCFGFLEGA